MSKTSTLRFRHNQAISVAAVIAFLGALPLATARWYLAPLLLVPVAIGAWALRAGTDADTDGVRIRALLGQHRIPWSDILELAADPRGRAMVRLRDGRTTALPAVRSVDLPALISASGQSLDDSRPNRTPAQAHDGVPGRTDPAGQ
ncbi:PH domain-containing protein [Plantactinospora sp. S1510]|uniref:PH domain-containing protein n=1 Tax=Plantactinospora alkalitolerans TaxID=2789879 RepID=A0ABS0H0A6_9ACTN|nr:PH domain-containing protein [Plantactinospora alkalitolerans]MBF9131893.1 PH domain-containing protein [Plantactinospora alkalitolerans]